MRGDAARRRDVEIIGTHRDPAPLSRHAGALSATPEGYRGSAHRGRPASSGAPGRDDVDTAEITGSLDADADADGGCGSEGDHQRARPGEESQRTAVDGRARPQILNITPTHTLRRRKLRRIIPRPAYDFWRI